MISAMNCYHCIRALALAAAFVVSSFGGGVPQRITLVTWNVENLFDHEDDPANPGDDEFTPHSWRRWTESRYRQKLANLAKVIGALKPDILLLQEIENRRVLDDLAAVLREKEKLDLPHVAHRDSPDFRGIDTAVLSRWQPAETNWLSPSASQREMAAATFAFDGAPLAVVCCHWKSQSGNSETSGAIRAVEARTLRRYIGKQLKPGAAVVVGGDFNDNITSLILTDAAGLHPYGGPRKALPEDGLLYNLSGVLPEPERGTYYYAPKKVWNSFDSFSVSEGMLPNAATNLSPWKVVLREYGRHRHPAYLSPNDQSPLPYRRVRTKTFDGYYLGASDHFPVKLVLERRPAPVPQKTP